MSKNITLALMAAGLFAASTASVLAVDTGTITFSGRVLADTCEIKLNGSSTMMVEFTDTYTSDFTGVGTAGTSKPVAISLTGCDTQISKLNLKFTGVTDGDATRLTNTTSGGAQNVAITMTNDNGSVPVNFDGSDPGSGTDATTSAGAANFNYTAKVIQVGTDLPTPGQYTATATVDLIYR